MAFSGGTFSRTFDCTTDRDNGVKILASKFDTELDGMATGLSTCILKDGTQTCTAAIPFAEGLTVPDNKTIILGTNSDITIQYDETTNDSLEIAANVEGAALGIVLKADQGDDNADQHKVNIADGGTLTMASKISGSFVSYLTHTPNSTVASSTTAVAGNLTVGGALTLGSGAVISEAELETIDGITPGTAAASKAMVLDASLDISGGRNLTISGELDAATLDVSGDVDIDGTLETDALSIASTAVTATGAELNYSDTGAAVGTVVASKVVTADANKDVASFRNITLTGELDAGSLDVSGDADIDGTLEADAMTLNGTAITATATLDTGISNNNVPKFTSGVADDDFLRVAGTAIEGRSAAEVLSDIGASAVAGSSSIVTTGALNAGSITSGFGAIDNGSSAITTTGVGSFGSLDISGGIDVDGTTDLDTTNVVGAFTVTGDVTLNDGSPNLRLKDTDVNRYVDLMYGTRVSTIRNTMASGEDMDSVEPSMVFSFKDDSETRTAMTIDHDAATTIHSSGGATPTYSHTNNGEGLTFRYNDDSGARAADIIATGNTPAGATMAMRFFTNPASTDAAAEVMRLQDGKVKIGTTATALESAGNEGVIFHPAGKSVISQDGTVALELHRSDDDTADDTVVLLRRRGSICGSISCTPSATSFNTSSDYRLKTSVTYDWDATTRLKKLKPARFKWIADGDDAVFVDGFIADEAQTVVPESVTGTKDAMTDAVLYVDGDEIPDDKKVGDVKTEPQIDPQGIDQSKIVPLLTKALIESVEKIEALEARITALEAG